MEKVSIELQELYNRDAERIANFVIKKYPGAISYFGDVEDMRQSLLMKMWILLPCYDKLKGKFSTFMIIVCKHEICKQIQKYKTKKRAGSVISINHEIADGLTIEDTLFEEYDICEEIDNQEQVKTIVSMLNRVAYAHFIDGMTLDEIGRALGRTRSWVSIKIQKNLNRIKAIMLSGSKIILRPSSVSNALAEYYRSYDYVENNQTSIL